MDDLWAERYRGAVPEAQARFLAALAAALTIVARSAYPEAEPNVSGPARVELLRGINELQHKILEQLLHLLRGDAHRYPDDVFCNTLGDFDTERPAQRNGWQWAIRQAAWALDARR